MITLERTLELISFLGDDTYSSFALDRRRWKGLSAPITSYPFIKPSRFLRIKIFCLRDAGLFARNISRFSKFAGFAGYPIA